MSGSTSRFRPGSHQRGEETRARILNAALELFAQSGFEGASTRTIAEDAGVNLPAIQYYFGSKEGLYRAVIGQFSDHIRAGVAPVAERISAELAAGPCSRRRLIELLGDMLDVIVGLILDSGQPDYASRQKLFARMEIEPSPAAEALQDEMVRHVCAPCCDIIGRLIERPPDDEQVLLHTITIIGQAKVFCGWSTRRVLRWEDTGAEQVRAAQAVIRDHVNAIFRGTRDR